MTKEELIKNQFPNDEFLQSGVSQIVDKCIAELEKENAELKSENQKWKDEWQKQVQKATDEGYARTLQTIQLTKAKELLKGWLGDFYNPKAFYQQRAELVEQSEKFIKYSEGK